MCFVKTGSPKVIYRLAYSNIHFRNEKVATGGTTTMLSELLTFVRLLTPTFCKDFDDAEDVLG